MRMTIVKEAIYREYVINKKKPAEMAKFFNTDIKYILYLLDFYKISRRSHEQDSLRYIDVSKEQLKKMHFENKMSMSEIGKEIGTTKATISRKFKKFDLVFRGYDPNKTEKILIDMLEGTKYKHNRNFKVGNKIPDFINIKKEKKVIELFGEI
ncbi:MAG: hypothetical protein KJ697_02620 [Nanoarchaeota archaeon]|nr:hypothetical protein [Nanoarchaeota archaeon]MBU4124451.1 hypothetical protein [Nanoarchaeota archaeon]